MTASDTGGATVQPASWALLAATTGLLVWALGWGGGAADTSIATLGSAAVVVAALSAAAAAFGALSLPRVDRAGAVALAAAVALVIWVGVSVAWSVAGDRSWAALAKGLVYLAYVVLGLAVVASVRERGVRAAAAMLAVAFGVTVGWALLSRAFPGLFPDGGRIARLREPIGYWNALALVAGAAVPLGLWLVLGLSRALRAAGALLVFGGVTVVLLTQSRAGVLALVVGLALWLALEPRRLEGALAAVCAGVPGAVVAGWAFTRPALVDDGALRADRARDGAVFAVLAVVAAVIAVALVDRAGTHRPAARDPARVRRIVIVAAVLLAVFGAVGVVASVGNPISWTRDQVSGGECTNDPGRLTDLCANNRPSWWGDAIAIARKHPLGGSGALTFEIARKRVRDDGTPVSQPHSVPLQLLADLGVIGLALGLGFAVAVGAGARRALRQLDGAERSAAAAVVCVPVVYAVHALVDYDLDFLAVTAPALLACGALLAAGRPPLRVRTPLVLAVASVAVAAAVIVVLATPRLAQREVDRSTRLLDGGRSDAAADAARRARALDPLALDPVWAAAAAADRGGDEALAQGLYRRATEMQPENPETWIALGLYELAGRQDLCAAYYALNNAYTLDPKGRQWVPGGPLDVTRDAVNAGACEP